MTVRVTAAREEWFDTMAAIAAEGGSPDACPEYLAHLSRHGRLLAAVEGETVVAMGGAVEAHGARMVSDLFVDPARRGEGVGTRVLAELLQGSGEAFTFSSTHPAALAAYRHAGLTAGWPLLTMRGAASGNGAPLPSHDWSFDRPELAAHVVAQGGLCTGNALIGRATDGASVLRLVGDGAPDTTLEWLMGGLTAGASVELSVPAHSPVLAWLVLHGFRIVDVDVFCATPGVVLPSSLWVMHRGMC